MTGTTVHRTGIEGNKMVTKRFNSYKRMASVKKRVDASETFEQLLAERRGYAVVRKLCYNE